MRTRWEGGFKPKDSLPSPRHFIEEIELVLSTSDARECIGFNRLRPMPMAANFERRDSFMDIICQVLIHSCYMKEYQKNEFQLKVLAMLKHRAFYYTTPN